MSFESKINKLIEKEVDRRFREFLPDEMKVAIVGDHGKASVFVNFVDYDKCVCLQMSDCIERNFAFDDNIKHQGDIAAAIDQANFIRDDLHKCIEMIEARIDELSKLIE